MSLRQPKASRLDLPGLLQDACGPDVPHDGHPCHWLAVMEQYSSHANGEASVRIALCVREGQQRWTTIFEFWLTLPAIRVWIQLVARETCRTNNKLEMRFSLEQL